MLNDDDNGFVFAGEQSGEYQSNSSIYRFDIMPMPSTLSLQPYGVAVQHKGRRGSDRTVVGIKTTYATNAYHH
jgi:hypothetical protein